MKREGRQHGVVRSYPILPTPLSHRTYVKTVDPTSVKGVFTKVSTKPTNHSKFTGKCSTARCMGCHIHPTSKSKDKAKGTVKLRSIGFDVELIWCWSGASTTRAFGYLGYDGSGYDARDEYEYEYGYEYEYDYGDEAKCVGLESVVTNERIVGGDKDGGDGDECMSYCDVGLGWVGERGGEGEGGEDEWYLVGHLE